MGPHPSFYRATTLKIPRSLFRAKQAMQPSPDSCQEPGFSGPLWEGGGGSGCGQGLGHRCRLQQRVELSRISGAFWQQLYQLGCSCIPHTRDETRRDAGKTICKQGNGDRMACLDGSAN